MSYREAFVLHARSWRDTGSLVDLLVRDQGLVRAVARGVRGKRRGGNPCQLFQPLVVVLGGRSALKTVQHIEVQGPRCALLGRGVFGGLYANEVLLRSLPETEPNNILFGAYETLLQQLAGPEVDLEPPLRRFECVLLAELGYAVDFSRDAVSGEPLLSTLHYRFVPAMGFVPAEAAELSADAPSFAGRLLRQVALGELDDAASRRCAKLVMRMALREVIGDKPLQSRLLFSSGVDS